MNATELLQTIIDHYLGSGDFNGLPLRPDSPLLQDRDLLASLIAEGLVETISEEDFPNPHIRPWSNQRPRDAQVNDIDDVARGNRTVCLYPTPAALAPVVDPALFQKEPYRRRLAEGGGQLEPVYFDFDVLESYRNDPRFRYEQWDFGLEISVTDSVYGDENVPERDKTSVTVGYAYNVTSLNEGPIARRACAFLTDLADLTPEHQRRWETYEVEPDGVLPHPEWTRSMSGHFPEGSGPFERFMSELEAVNELSLNAFGEPFFSTTERPDDFGWITRASTQEWDRFVLTLDKLISDNIRSA
ncbi:MAG: hypothetical protein O2822_07495, partial [Chloroflexi bacterium]|nr:hypothetical protein [Chloroflexota bacterium]